MRMRVLKLATPFVPQTQDGKLYFCPVTFELLIDPVQTNFCCGNHLSRAVAEQLQAEGKPCPLCTVEDGRRFVFQAQSEATESPLP